MEKIKALFFAQYIFQDVFAFDTAEHTYPCGPDTITTASIGGFVDGYLLLRDISQLTDGEKAIIATRMQIYPEDVIDWINGDCGHGDYENLNTWLPCYDILKAFGILLPFTYLNEENKPITLTPADLIAKGWAKIK